MRRGTRAHYLKHKETARAIAHSRLAYFNQLYGFELHKIFIKNHRSRWGSASKKGNINFNYKIALLPSPLADYVIVHELCHLGEFNHSPHFWALVERALPEWKLLRRELRKVG